MLLVIYAGFAILLYVPRHEPTRWRFAVQSCLRMLPALILAYLVMNLAWPWAALAPLNPIRGLLAFSEFQYGVRTTFDGQTYEMANVPRLYVPTYILIRVPLLTLFGAALALFHALPRLAPHDRPLLGRDIALLALTVIFPLACQVIYHGPAFSGLRQFLVVSPALAALAGIGLDAALSATARRGRAVASAAVALMAAMPGLGRSDPWRGCIPTRTCPTTPWSEGSRARRGATIWITGSAACPKPCTSSKPISAVPRRSIRNWPAQVYSVAVCGERLPVREERHAAATAL